MACMMYDSEDSNFNRIFIVQRNEETITAKESGRRQQDLPDNKDGTLSQSVEYSFIIEYRRIMPVSAQHDSRVCLRKSFLLGILFLG
jgi:hypothetical protein